MYKCDNVCNIWLIVYNVNIDNMIDNSCQFKKWRLAAWCDFKVSIVVVYIYGMIGIVYYKLLWL